MRPVLRERQKGDEVESAMNNGTYGIIRRITSTRLFGSGNWT